MKSIDCSVNIARMLKRRGSLGDEAKQMCTSDQHISPSFPTPPPPPNK